MIIHEVKKTGIAPLKEGETIYTTAEQKSSALNKQFQSVFTTEDLSNIPQLDYSVHPSIQNL